MPRALLLCTLHWRLRLLPHLRLHRSLRRRQPLLEQVVWAVVAPLPLPLLVALVVAVAVLLLLLLWLPLLTCARWSLFWTGGCVRALVRAWLQARQRSRWRCCGSCVWRRVWQR